MVPNTVVLVTDGVQICGVRSFDFLPTFWKKVRWFGGWGNGICRGVGDGASLGTVLSYSISLRSTSLPLPPPANPDADGISKSFPNDPAFLPNDVPRRRHKIQNRSTTGPDEETLPRHLPRLLPLPRLLTVKRSAQAVKRSVRLRAGTRHESEQRSQRSKSPLEYAVRVVSCALVYVVLPTWREESPSPRPGGPRSP